MPLRRTEKLSSYFIGTAYLSHGEFSISYTEIQEGKRVAAHTLWQRMWSHADRWARWPVKVSWPKHFLIQTIFTSEASKVTSKFCGVVVPALH